MEESALLLLPFKEPLSDAITWSRLPPSGLPRRAAAAARAKASTTGPLPNISDASLERKRRSATSSASPLLLPLLLLLPLYRPEAFNAASCDVVKTSLNFSPP